MSLPLWNSVAQFAMGVKFLGTGLYSLGQNDSTKLPSDSPLLRSFVTMFASMGDRLSLQYGGSAAQKRVSNADNKAVESQHAVSSRGELLTSIKRYYSNAFTDRLKQDAINLFLGAFIPLESSIPLWDIESDYHMHHRKDLPPPNSTVMGASRADWAAKGGDTLRLLKASNIESLRKYELCTRYVLKEGALDSDESLRLMLESEARKEGWLEGVRRAAEIEQEDWLAPLRLYDSFYIDRAKYSKIYAMGFAEGQYQMVSFDEVLSSQHSRPKDTSMPVINAPDCHDPALDPSDAPTAVSTITATPAAGQQSRTDSGIIHAHRQFSDDVGDMISHYVRSLSTRAKTLVNTLVPHSPESKDTLRPKTIVINAATNKTSSWAPKPTLQEEARYYDVDDVSAALYSTYTGAYDVDDCDRDKEIEEAQELKTRRFYERSFGGLLIDSDDVAGMERLAIDCGLCSTIREGCYAGMKYGDSALLAAGTVDLSLTYLERHLQQSGGSVQGHESTRVLLSEAFCTELDVMRNAEVLTPGLQNEVINRSLQFLSHRQFYTASMSELPCAEADCGKPSPSRNCRKKNSAEERDEEFFHQYPGFTRIADDKYRRDVNPLMIMNVPAAKTFSSLFQGCSIKYHPSSCLQQN